MSLDTPKASGASRLDEAELLIAELFAEQEAGHEARLEALIARRPDLEPELRQMWAQLGVVAQALGDDARHAARERAHVTEMLRGLATTGSFAERYALESEIGRGGMGTVLRVRDRKLDRPLAMKLITRQASLTPAGKTPSIEARQLTRFLNEARITSQLDHPAIVPVHEVGVDEDGRAYFTMKLVQGATLAEVFERRAAGDPRWSTRRVLGALQRVCEALAFAHGRGVIHRDLKPHNVMAGDFGEVYVMDWGLARRLDEPEAAAGTRELDEQLDEQLVEQTTLTGAGHVLGTPAYMSPEQARGEIERMGPQSDVYAVGAMLYQLISGHAPYTRPGERASGSEILARVVAGRPQPLQSSMTPRELIAICEKAMSYEREARYASMRELGDELQRFLDDRVVLAFRTGALERLRKWVKRNRALSAALSSAGLAIALGVVLGVQSRRHAEEREFAAAFRRGETALAEALHRSETALAEAFRRGEIALATDSSGSGPEQIGKRRAALLDFQRSTDLRRDDRNSWLRLTEARLRLEEVEPARVALARAEALGANGYYALRLRAWIERGSVAAREDVVPPGLPADVTRWDPIDRIDRASLLYGLSKFREAYELLADIEEDPAPSAPTVAGRLLRGLVLHSDAVANKGNTILQDRAEQARLALRAYDAALRATPDDSTIEFNRFLLLLDAGNDHLELGMTVAERLADMDRYAERMAEGPISRDSIEVQLKDAWAHIEADVARDRYAQKSADLVRGMSKEEIGKLGQNNFTYLLQILVIAGDFEQALERSQQWRFSPGQEFNSVGPLHTVLLLYKAMLGWKLMEPAPERIEAFLEASHDKVKANDFDAAVSVLEGK